MRLSPVATVAILALIFVVAVGVRLVDDGPTSPYFKGASAMNHRHAIAAADGVPLDASDTKAGWPEGYHPSGYRSSGVERFAAGGHRAARYFSEVDARPFSSRLLVVWVSLCVFTLYAFVRRLWDCQAAGLIAAAMVAAFAPFVEVTDGGQFLHAPFAMTLVTVHALVLLASHRRRSPGRGVLAAVVAYPIMAWWEAGLYYVAAVTALVALLPGPDDGRRRWAVAAHALAALVACFVEGYLSALRAAFTWPMVLLVVVTAVTFAGGRLAGRWKRLAAVAGATLVVTAVLAPVRAGADASVPALEYLWYRLRFIGGKPLSPGLLPPEVRALWSFEHAPPSPHQLLNVFLPLAFLAAATLAGARDHLRRHPIAFVVAAAAAAVGSAAWAVDRAMLVPALFAVTPFVALAGHGLSAALPTRGPLVAIGAWLMVSQILFPLGAANPAYQIAKGAGIAHRDPHRFLWVSTENTDRQLVGFVASRTRVRDPFLGSDNITALLLAFAGRTSVPLPGAVQTAAAARNADLANALYQDEASLYARCRELEVSYVLYSIDYLLDVSRYSPSYLAGVTEPSRESAVFRMHFDPESLRHFTLVYENEHYRLYRVTDEPEPLFLTDHPPVFQRDAFERVAGDRQAFRQRLLDLLMAYRQGVRARARGETERALDHFSWCLQQAPGYTQARVAIGTTLIQAERLEDAREVLLSVVGYAPDNAPALYYTAYVHAALGETDRARQYLQLFFSTATDTDLIERGRLLEAYVDQGIPVTPRSIPE